jgi:sarcosine oxidase
MAKSFDVIVVGVGAMGASACSHLADRGARVLGLEQFDIPNSRGSSHGFSRMIRLAYYEKPDYVPLLHRSYQLWDELEKRSQQRLLFRVGGVYIGPETGLLLKGSRESARKFALDVEMLSHKELGKRWPQFVVPRKWIALFDPAAGFLRPERVITAYATLAMRAGAQLHGNEPVRQWRATDRQVTVRTDRGEYKAGQLIFTGGAWSAKLLGELGLPLKVTRQVVGWVWPRRPELFELGRLPVWGIDAMQQRGIYYGFPMIPDAPGFKLAHHWPTAPSVDPDKVTREPSPGDEKDFRPVLKRHIPDADGSLLATRVCLYTNSPDEDFILDHHPQHPRVQIACGFSGHGFKFASVIGEILADRATLGSSSNQADFLKLRAFPR